MSLCACKRDEIRFPIADPKHCEICQWETICVACRVQPRMGCPFCKSCSRAETKKCIYKPKACFCEKSLPLSHPTYCAQHFFITNRQWQKGTTCAICGRWCFIKENHVSLQHTQIFACHHCQWRKANPVIPLPQKMKLVIKAFLDFTAAQQQPVKAFFNPAKERPLRFREDVPKPRKFARCASCRRDVAMENDVYCEACKWEKLCVRCREVDFFGIRNVCNYCEGVSKGFCTSFGCHRKPTRPTLKPQQCVQHFVEANAHWLVGNTCCFCGNWAQEQSTRAYAKNPSLFACNHCAVKYTKNWIPLLLDVWQAVWQYIILK